MIQGFAKMFATIFDNYREFRPFLKSVNSQDDNFSCVVGNILGVRKDIVKSDK